MKKIIQELYLNRKMKVHTETIVATSRIVQRSETSKI